MRPLNSCLAWYLNVSLLHSPVASAEPLSYLRAFAPETWPLRLVSEKHLQSVSLGLRQLGLLLALQQSDLSGLALQADCAGHLHVHAQCESQGSGT